MGERRDNVNTECLVDVKEISDYFHL